ncbi:tyrosinase family protein [Micropruina sp.]|uniref:tyrosinase family protein n=1 Tax=Micropruina sp. TaxID=2737536 RepID=UPI002612B7E4|nr:tyrosinase family protein [Micropruina sp.]
MLTPPQAEALVRQDVYTLQPEGAPTHPIIAAYAVAVRELKRNSGPQHRWWSHHTQVHGMFPDPNDGLRNTCQHFCWYFLPWHRMYLHAFEAICRSIIAESDEVDDETKATWALPYWDYDRPESSSLPPAFRAPTLDDGSPNPLFDPARDLGVNSPVRFRGEPEPRLARLQPAQTTAAGWFFATPYSSQFDPAFAGTETGFNHAGAPNAIPGPLEITPHGSVHVFVGGPTGKMSDFNQAAGDAIFWLHHANLDRLWEVWRGNTGIGLDPAGSRFVDRSFEFLDASGLRIEPTCGSVLNLANLGYSYADTSIPASAGAGGQMPTPDRGPERPRDRRPPQRVGAAETPVRLTEDATEVSFPTDAPTTRAAQRFLVSVEHIRADRLPSAEWGVFLHPTSGEPVLVGTLPLFGLLESQQPDAEHELSYQFDITAVVQRLDAEDRWDAEQFRATLAPVNPIAEDAPPEPEVVIGTIALLIQ